MIYDAVEFLVVAHEKPDYDYETGNAEHPRDEILHFALLSVRQ
jgi:hypothetical protein